MKVYQDILSTYAYIMILNKTTYGTYNLFEVRNSLLPRYFTFTCHRKGVQKQRELSEGTQNVHKISPVFLLKNSSPGIDLHTSKRVLHENSRIRAHVSRSFK